MVERIMLLKLGEAYRSPEHGDAHSRTELAKRLRGLLLGVAGIEDVSVGVPADAAAEKSWDLSVVMLFVSEAVTSVTLESESYKAFLDELTGKVEVIKAWNFERLS